ncbi:metallophosphoesterase [Changchengzhania lutea]|uniref:metallophosphoesterase n=1 Tax=Changchengzhania lutea TaxID=2049305 RepID=UPI00115E8E7C|nr:metallophosphoesterase [Changchengzhania lutea]
MIKILHITDFHFKSKTYDRFSQDQIIDKLCIELESSKKEVDIIVFTGDLVHSGVNYKDFEEANNVFLERIVNASNIKKENVIFCAGNHDVDRSKKLDSLEFLFDQKITNSDQLFDFVSKETPDYLNSIEGIKNYNSFRDSYYSHISNTKLNKLYTTHIREINGISTGFVTLNSSWRALDDSSYGKLLFPIYQLESALNEIKETQCKFLLIHHPLFWFKEFNYFELQELIHKNFDIIFSGHVHESKVSSHYKYSNGIFEHVAAASMTYDRNYVGFSIIQYEPMNKSQALIKESKYIPEFNKFVFDEEITVNIPAGDEKTNQNVIRSKMLNKAETELSRAADLLLNYTNNEEDSNVFLKMFNVPIIKSKTVTNTSLEKKASINYFEKLLDNDGNYFVFGHDKCGKTSLLKYFQINHLKKYATNGNVPFYIDMRELIGVIDENWNVLKHMARYFELSLNKTKDLIKEHRFRLLIDNFEPNSLLFKKINDFLVDYPNVNFVICSDQITSRIVDDYDFGIREYKKLYFHDISRKEVRTYADKWFNIAIDNKDEVLDKLISFCKQMEMPLNYWTISILLLIHKKSKFDLSKNVFEVLDLCVDEILNKKFLSLSKSRINFNQLKVLCGELSFYLLQNHKKTVYSTSYREILNFLEEKIDANIRLNANSKEVLDFLLSSGLLRIKEDDNIEFRLPGVFEYFIAYHMSKNSELVDTILEQDDIYLSFKNEFEIYSGLNNGDSEFLEKIFSKTKSYFKNVNEEFSQQGGADNLLLSYVSENYTQKLEEIAKKMIAENPLTDDVKDELMDQFDPIATNQILKTKKVYNIQKLNSEIFERYLSILARVYKTMDNINDSELLNKIFDFLLDTYVNFGFYLIKEIENEKLFKDFTDQDSNSEINILDLLSKVIPIITQSTFSDGIAHYNVEGIILNKIAELKTSDKANQYKIFILYFVLMDIDEKNIIEYADEIISYAKMGVIKYSVVFKLTYYFSFNGQRSKKVAEFLRERIKVAQLKMDNKIDKDKLQKSLQKKQNKGGFHS